MVNTWHKLCLSARYKRVVEVENKLASSVCKRFTEEGIVCPVLLRKNLFTVEALDNIDHKSSSTTAEGSFHGTGISVFQFPTSSNHGINREPVEIEPECSQASTF